MRDPELPLQHLLTLPARMAGRFAELEGKQGPGWFAGHDPVGRPLGSGGGTAHLLVEAWRATGGAESMSAWLKAGRKLILHAGGQSRRLPAYACSGKALMPMPVMRWSRGQRLDQTLLDMQLPDFHRVLRHAPRSYVALLASGDVMLRFALDLPDFPEVDVLGLGMWTTPAQAKDFGVFFTPRRKPGELTCFLQKPAPEAILALADEQLFLVDTGMWLLSERAVGVLLERCGWSGDEEGFAGGRAAPYEFYGAFAPALGRQPALVDPAIAGLSAAVVVLPRPEFLHFGTSRQMIESVSALQNRELDQTRMGRVGTAWHPDQFTLNARLERGVHRGQNPTLWIENSVIPDTWTLAREHVLTGVPENRWTVRLEPGVCLEFVPVDDELWCVRFYGIDDRFSGRVTEESTRWLGRPVTEWLARRGLGRERLGDGVEGLDVQDARLFPVLEHRDLDGAFLEWLFAERPAVSAEWAARWAGARRLSAGELPAVVNLDRVYAQRAALRAQALDPLMRHRQWSVFYRLDLERTAALFAGSAGEVPVDEGAAGEPLHAVHHAMFVSAVRRHRGDRGWEADEQRAFEILRETLVRDAQVAAVSPRLSVVEDQIVWARSPVRLDLAGGWTDTPPYCLEHGGAVVNVAVDLNGQAPMQVFVRVSPRPEIVLRSIDLGAETRIRTYAELEADSVPGDEFALSKAACGLAGFLPRFHATGGYATLREQLEAFGGGLELSVLSAVPKGSGLGTSSILAGTVLAALSEVCGLGWDRNTLFARTLVLEQIIRSGGGWQDQAGGLFPGVKLIETTPGLTQVPRMRWLPGQVLDPARDGDRVLLFYTGLTRAARGILAEIVRGIFLNSPEHLATLESIRASAYRTALALEGCGYEELAAAVQTTWELKQALDRGTNPPDVRDMIEAVRSELLGAMLPGAGGGGYLLMFARDADAARRIRRRLTERPPNARARFVEFGVSGAGLRVTRS